MGFVVSFFSLLLPILEMAIIGRVIVSWVDREGKYAISRILNDITEPIVGPIRRLLPSLGMLDLSPLIALLLLSVLEQVVQAAAAG